MNEVLDTLLEAFEAALTTTFKGYFKGRIELMAQDDLPMLMVYPLGTRQRRSGTLRDSTEYDIAVEAAVSVKKYLNNKTGQGDKLDTLDALIALVEDRDAQGAAGANTLIGLINANLTAAGLVLYNDGISVQYDQYLSRGTFPVARATVRFTAYDRPNRTA